MPEYLTVTRVSALPPGMGTVVTVKGHELAVFNVEGKFHAMDNRCPHQDYPLGMSPIFDKLGDLYRACLALRPQQRRMPLCAGCARAHV